MATQPTQTLKKDKLCYSQGCKIIQASPLPPGHLHEDIRITLTRALTPAKDKTTNIRTGSEDTFSILHSHAATWLKRGLITPQETPQH